MTDERKRIVDRIDAISGAVVEISRKIHGNPEIGGQEFFASSSICAYLEEQGFRVERSFNGIPTAFLARVGNSAGVKVAYLAEYDALPGLGHACGHNLICGAAIAAGVGLAAVLGECSGEVWIIGTPAEESDGAKVAMARAGVFDPLDAALMLHPGDGNYYITESLAMDAIEAEFAGKPSHASASPWDGCNALDAQIVLFTSLNALRQQLKPDARIHGIIAQGGLAPNIIPEKTVSRFYLRARKRAYVNELVAKFKNCAEAAALATSTKCALRNYEASFDDMASNEVLSLRFRDYMVDTLGSGAFERAPDSFGSVDMGNVSHHAPAVHALVDIANGVSMSAHTQEFRDAAAKDYAFESMIRGAKALALTGYDVFSDKDFRAAARNEFKARCLSDFVQLI